MHNFIHQVQGPPLISTSIIWPGQKTIPTNPVYGPLHGTSIWATIVNPGDKQRLCTKATSWIYSYIIKNKIITKKLIPLLSSWFLPVMSLTDFTIPLKSKMSKDLMSIDLLSFNVCKLLISMIRRNFWQSLKKFCTWGSDAP